MSTLLTPVPGAVYSFVFKDGYTAQNGIYRLVKLMTYNEYLEDGGDILSDFFTPNNKTETDLSNDLEMIQETKIMKLTSPDDLDQSGEPVFAPLAYLKSTPDFNVKKYSKLAIMAYIGVTEDPELLSNLKNTLTEQIEATTGVTPDPIFSSVGHVWLTDSQYAEVLAKRDATKKHALNYYSENLRLEKLLSQRNTQVKAYEELLIGMQTTIDELKAQLEQLRSQADPETGG